MTHAKTKKTFHINWKDHQKNIQAYSAAQAILIFMIDKFGEMPPKKKKEIYRKLRREAKVVFIRGDRND